MVSRGWNPAIGGAFARRRGRMLLTRESPIEEDKKKAAVEAEARAKEEKEAAEAAAAAEAARAKEEEEAAAAAAAAAAEPQLSPAEQADANKKVYEFGSSGDVKKLIQALKDGGTPDGHKVRE